MGRYSETELDFNFGRFNGILDGRWRKLVKTTDCATNRSQAFFESDAKVIYRNINFKLNGNFHRTGTTESDSGFATIFQITSSAIFENNIVEFADNKSIKTVQNKYISIYSGEFIAAATQSVNIIFKRLFTKAFFEPIGTSGLTGTLWGNSRFDGGGHKINYSEMYFQLRFNTNTAYDNFSQLAPYYNTQKDSPNRCSASFDKFVFETSLANSTVQKQLPATIPSWITVSKTNFMNVNTSNRNNARDYLDINSYWCAPTSRSGLLIPQRMWAATVSFPQ